MADVVNIPINSDDLYLLRLEPDTRSAWFRHDSISTGVWYEIECDEKIGFLMGIEFREEPGGAISIHEDHKVADTLMAQALRITRMQFEAWDAMELRERLSLQRAWVNDALRAYEQQLVRALERPHHPHDPGGVRYEYSALVALTTVLVQTHGELTGLDVALESL